MSFRREYMNELVAGDSAAVNFADWAAIKPITEVKDLVRNLLYWFADDWATRSMGSRPTEYRVRLFELLAVAGPDEMEELNKAHPMEVAGYHLAQRVDGMDALRKMMGV